MKRLHLEHLLRAAGEITGTKQIVVIGSQAALAKIANLPEIAGASMEGDLYIPGDPQKTDQIEGSLGEGSPFHQSHGFYAQAVDEFTATLPNDWITRAIRFTSPATNGVTGICPDPHDIALSKYFAGRPKDYDYNRDLIAHGHLKKKTLLNLIRRMPIDDTAKERIKQAVNRDFDQIGPQS